MGDDMDKELMLRIWNAIYAIDAYDDDVAERLGVPTSEYSTMISKFNVEIRKLIQSKGKLLLRNRRDFLVKFAGKLTKEQAEYVERTFKKIADDMDVEYTLEYAK